MDCQRVPVAEYTVAQIVLSGKGYFLALVLGVRKTGLEEIFSECQVISNHLANEVHRMAQYILRNT